MSLHDHVAYVTRARCMECGSSSCAVIANVIYVGPMPSRLSRREQRLARKAAKNREMYKTYGRRPWARETGRGIFAYAKGHRFPCDTYDNLYTCHRIQFKPGDSYGRMVARDRVPSGFSRFSQWIEKRWPK